jgi:hypothetical protein
MRLYYGKSLHALDHFLTPTKTVPISTNNESEEETGPIEHRFRSSKWFRSSRHRYCSSPRRSRNEVECCVLEVIFALLLLYPR